MSAQEVAEALQLDELPNEVRGSRSRRGGYLRENGGEGGRGRGRGRGKSRRREWLREDGREEEREGGRERGAEALHMGLARALLCRGDQLQ
eukprot:2339829-Rhodomonas_salina.1